MNYQLLSLERKERLRIQVKLPGNDPTIQSLTTFGRRPIGTNARFSICSACVSKAIPDLTRILMPDDWEGYPLRKDYPVEGYR